jgi:hypothetical protein
LASRGKRHRTQSRVVKAKWSTNDHLPKLPRHL